METIKIDITVIHLVVAILCIFGPGGSHLVTKIRKSWYKDKNVIIIDSVLIAPCDVEPVPALHTKNEKMLVHGDAKNIVVS